MEIELRDRDAARTRAVEVARILLEEAQSMKRLVDYDLLRVSDENGNVVAAGRLKELGAERRPAPVDATVRSSPADRRSAAGQSLAASTAPGGVVIVHGRRAPRPSS
jgi:hypothetical protein